MTTALMKNLRPEESIRSRASFRPCTAMKAKMAIESGSIRSAVTDIESEGHIIAPPMMMQRPIRLRIRGLPGIGGSCCIPQRTATSLPPRTGSRRRTCFEITKRNAKKKPTATHCCVSCLPNRRCRGAGEGRRGRPWRASAGSSRRTSPRPRRTSTPASTWPSGSSGGGSCPRSSRVPTPTRARARDRCRRSRCATPRRTCCVRRRRTPRRVCPRLSLRTSPCFIKRSFACLLPASISIVACRI
jgi:hypothetical protein